MKNSTKKNKIISLISERIRTQSISYQIFKKLWNHLTGLNIGVLDRSVLEAVILYLSNSIISGNNEAIFSGSKYEAVAIPSSTLKTIFGNRYPEYISFLRQHNILWRTSYQVGTISYQFSINPVYMGVIIFRTIENSHIRKAIVKYNLSEFEDHKSLYNKSYNALYWFTTGKLTIKKDLAINLIFSFQQRLYSLITSRKYTVTNKKLAPTMFLNALVGGLKSTTNIETKHYNEFIHYRGWRLYSEIANMQSVLRNYLRYDGHELCAIDIKNSQATHLCILFRSSFWAPQSAANSFKTFYLPKELNKKNTLYDYFNSNKHLLRAVRNLIKQQPADLVQFENLCGAGKLYEHLSKSLKGQYPSWHKDREASKARWVLFLNCDLKHIKSSAYADYQKFKQLFPSVSYIIELMKHKNYKEISMLLSRIEAKMLVQHFTNRFGEKLPDVPIFTVHDTFITLSKYKQQALTIFNSAYTEMGINSLTDGGNSLNHTNAFFALDSYLNKKLSRNAR